MLELLFRGGAESIRLHHGIVEWFWLKGKELQRSLSSNPLPQQRHLPLTRLLKTPSNLVFNISRNRAATVSLGHLFQHLPTLIVQNFFLISNLNQPCFSSKPLPYHYKSLLESPSPAFL